MGYFDLSEKDIYNSLLSVGLFYKNFDSNIQFNNLDRLHTLLTEINNGSYTVSKIMNSLQNPCFNNLRDCRWQGLETNCSLIFTQRKTDIGLCCIFNYQRLTPTKLQ